MHPELVPRPTYYNKVSGLVREESRERYQTSVSLVREAP